MLEKLCSELSNLNPQDYDSLPDIELYMDQVLEYISKTPISFSSEDKITSAMVNNYIKAGLVSRANGKKYDKRHFVNLLIIARLKQVLSVKYMNTLFESIFSENGEKEYYEKFRAMLNTCCEDAVKKLSNTDVELSALALKFAVESYVNKVVSEYILDMIFIEKDSEETSKSKEK